METSGIYQNRFKALNCCVLVPTYNNERTLASVVEGLMVYTNQIIVLNDGSTDNTREILQHFTQIEVRNFQKNRGKGKVLKKGFKIAEELGYDYAITIDSDGQHYPDDLDVFLSELEKRNPGDKEIWQRCPMVMCLPILIVPMSILLLNGLR